jgi:hypothetical protein
MAGQMETALAELADKAPAVKAGPLGWAPVRDASTLTLE